MIALQVRIAEGNYAAYFGWPMNLTNTNQGGFLGLPGGKPDAPMQESDGQNCILVDICSVSIRFNMLLFLRQCRLFTVADVGWKEHCM